MKLIVIVFLSCVRQANWLSQYTWISEKQQAQLSLSLSATQNRYSQSFKILSHIRRHSSFISHGQRGNTLTRQNVVNAKTIKNRTITICHAHTQLALQSFTQHNAIQCHRRSSRAWPPHKCTSGELIRGGFGYIPLCSKMIQ